jgi:hypothetical protein
MVRQIERLFIYMNADCAIPDGKRKYYAGTNRGQCWGPIVLPDVSTLWHVRLEDKKNIYMDAIRPVGGKADGDEDIDDAEMAAVEDETKQTKDSLVPLCWHAMPKMFWQEVLYTFKAKGIVDFTPGDGTLAEAAIEAKILYLGFGHTVAHCDSLRTRLVDRVFRLMQDEGSPLFSTACAAELGGAR